jgi:hypothetical protein
MSLISAGAKLGVIVAVAYVVFTAIVSFCGAIAKAFTGKKGDSKDEKEA